MEKEKTHTSVHNKALAKRKWPVKKTTTTNERAKNTHTRTHSAQNLLFNSKHDHVLFLLAVKHRDDDKDYNMLNNNVRRSNGLGRECVYAFNVFQRKHSSRFVAA